MTENCLELKNLKLTVENNLLLQVDEFYLKRGDITFVTGENGSGKSTLLKALFSVLKEDGYYSCEGEAQLNSSRGFTLNVLRNSGEELSSDNAQLSLVYISQDEYFGRFDSVVNALYLPTETALQRLSGLMSADEKRKKYSEAKGLCEEYAIKYFADLYKYDKKYKEARDSEKDRIVLNILRKKKARDCSGGQKKMLSVLSRLIKCVVMNVDLLVLDEPLNHLDHKNKQVINNILCDILTQKPLLSAIIVSHCLVFDFIADERCKQYYIDPRSKQLQLQPNKVFHDCLLKI